MRSMLMALSNGVKEPKMAEMMGKLLDSCMKKVMNPEMGMSDEVVTEMSMEPSLRNLNF